MPVPLNRLPRYAWSNAFVFLGYLALSLVMTRPLLTHLGTEIAGEGTDVWIHQWTFWWVKQALLNGHTPFYTTLLYYPDGVSLTSHNIAWFNIALWLPLQTILGSVIAYNLIFILVLAFNGFAFFLFAKAETGALAPAIVGGIIVGFWPYTYSHYDHPNFLAIFWVPLTMYLLLRTWRHQRWLDALLTAFSLAMIGISRWQVLVMSAPILLAYAIFLFWREPEGRTVRVTGLLLLVALLSVLLMAPLAAPLVLDQLGRSGPEVVAVAESQDKLATDLFSYVVPPNLYRRIWGNILDPRQYPVWDVYQHIVAGARYIPYIGLVTLMLAVYGIWRKWSQTWFWLLVALGIILMALGPVLEFNGQSFPQLPMPYRAFSGSLVDVLIRSPHRLNVLLSIPLAMMVTWGLVDLFSRLTAFKMKGGDHFLVALVVTILGALILWDNPIPPLPSTNTVIPQWYQSLAEDEEPFALLEIPFHNRGFDKLYMFYQTVHGKPILVGHVSRLPQEAFTFIDSIPFLQSLKSIHKWEVVDESWVDFDQVDVTRQIRLLSDEDIRYIVLNKNLIPEGYIDRFRDWITYNPDYEDDEVLVYSTSPQAGNEFEITKQMADGIGVLHSNIAPTDVTHGGVLKADLRWASSADPQEDYQVCFYLRNDQDMMTDTICEETIKGWPTSEWQANEVARGVYVLPISEAIPAGKYQVDVALARMGDQKQAGNALNAGEINILPFNPQRDISLCWDGKLCLSGYDINQNMERLDLTFYWQAAATPDRSFKRFVHLINKEGGKLVAQSDAVPRDWTYPTDIWEPDEIIVDHVSLQLDGLPAATYEVRVGWYAVYDREPLSACDNDNCGGDSASFHVLGNVIVSPET